MLISKTMSSVRIINLIPFLLFSLPMACFADSFFDNHQEGWFWYQDPAQNNSNLIPPTINRSATEQMNKLQKEVEESANLAILYPTEENLSRYAKNYHHVINQSQRFTDAYKLLLLKHPEFDYSLKFPLSPISQSVYDQNRERLIEDTIRQFAKKEGFFFFFSGQCPHCHVFAPTVKALSKKYQIAVIAISVDGGTLPEFPHAQQDQNASQRLGVSTLPALLAVNPKTGNVTPIANGAISIFELEENIFRSARGET